MASYNLLREKWIPIAGHDPVSLSDIFNKENLGFKAFGGTPVDKIVLMRFLLCIVHASTSVENDAAWAKLTPEIIAENARKYLQEHAECFDLFSEERPFLQIPALKDIHNQLSCQKEAKLKYITSSLLTTSENSSILTQWQIHKRDTASSIILVLLRTAVYALGGKRFNPKVSIAPIKKDKSGASGPLFGEKGYLHCYVTGETILEMLRNNLITDNDRKLLNYFDILILGKPFWEKMPIDEKDESYAKTYMGTLFPINKLMYIIADEMKVFAIDGYAYSNLEKGFWDPAIKIQNVSKSGKNKKTQKAVECNTSEHPWRQLTVLLDFLTLPSERSPYFWRTNYPKIIDKTKSDYVKLWCGGIKASNTTGEYSLKNDDDYIESEFLFPKFFFTEDGYTLLQNHMRFINDLKELLKYAVKVYYEKLNIIKKNKTGKAVKCPFINRAEFSFWNYMESEMENLFRLLNDYKNKDYKCKIYLQWINITKQCFVENCPAVTPKQFLAFTSANHVLHQKTHKLLNANE